MIIKSILFISLIFVITPMHSQDYMINFTGIGGSTSVETVKVENLNQGTIVILNGDDQLRLLETVNNIDRLSINNDHVLRIYPNPINDYSTIEFAVSIAGPTTIELFGSGGKRTATAEYILPTGSNLFKIGDLKKGIYILKMKSKGYSAVIKIVSNSNSTGNGIITYLSNTTSNVLLTASKSINTEKVMQYTTGDQLKITGISGNYSTVVMDIPTQSKTLTFNFVACTDGDGNNYPVVQIGNQTWMKENLKTIRLNDGTPILNATDALVWANFTKPCYCWYNNDTTTYKNIYGALYNWYTINTNKLCPIGWHVPTDTEWTTLIDYLGGQDVAGGKLKETGSTHWFRPNTGATDETGFTALPGGQRNVYGSFTDIHYYGYWWSATKHSTYFYWHRFMTYQVSTVYAHFNFERVGYSVRCVKD